MTPGSRLIFNLCLFVVLLATVTAPVAAHEPEEMEEMEEVVVEGRSTTLVGEARSASEGVIGQVDIELRPLLRPGDILESIPGMIVTQHSGSGKSNQMFLRGFNLDHGTDFATWIDGMPVNMRTHGHGQGYTDINFLIPETIETLRFVKGPYHAELGDFSSAGGAHISTFDRMPDIGLKLGLGEDGYRRMLATGHLDADTITVSGALEGQSYDGPWTDIDEDVNKINSLLKLSGRDGSQHWGISAMYYDNTWNSADQIPARAVALGLIDELGSLDDSLGGESHRASLSGHYQRDAANSSSTFNAYLIDYRMQLWSNFTYLLDAPLQGDQFEQYDDRLILGGSAQHQWGGGSSEQFLHRLGAELRQDDIKAVGLYHSHQRRRLDSVREDSVDESSIGIFYELEWQVSSQWRSLLGIRGDHYRFDVRADNAANSGKQSSNILSPKFSLIRALSETSEAYLSAGRGFHSNDARGTTIRIDPATGERAARVDPLVASTGAELGYKALWLDDWNSAFALWYLELDSELLFVGDAGNTEASRPSKRWGLELNNYFAINETWALEADFAWTDTKFADRAPEGDDIPGAIPFVATGAITADLADGWFGSFRVRHFSGFPLIEDRSEESDGSTFASLSFGWKSDTWRLQVDALNLFNSDDHDIDYFYASRLPGEPAEGIADNHYKVFEPRQLRAYIGISF
ncbi:TonB-dependent receptor [Biformimicrobium ophioploci]|uniref:TonB-dependent receptor n=1 Tax=Biformimicrobium ophioploci TaxID=3036711 RepID=A0ABQ6M2H2_9GAMM|nr:TonB-dependent receptor [Microbulbifer sp. NKW57]GMG88516.1 TonB-dependent receptor [Microbulbifer sp. NKW57]